ncbi:helix-turn-helix domain-containing protein [Haloarchaeobius sp. HRN-SO-5]|uniref:helix-turn-helix domain-containing protein n=1 Tax=Haloarchaeobius sp. HRN-SO-5 TaxID=3446118 RepID=UPI003EC08614
MSLYVTVSVDTPILKTASKHSPETTLSVTQQKMAPDGTVDITLQTRGGDVEQLEEGLDEDPTVDRWTAFGETGTDRLYQVYLNAYGSKVSTYNTWANEEAVFVSARPSENRWRETIRFHDRSGVEEYASFCDRLGLPFSLLRLRRASEDVNGLQYGLTEIQEQTLVTAFQHGYYAVPRDISLQELATSFDISHQALSERLRRGIGSLVQNTVVTMPLDQPSESGHAQAEVDYA